tara:strand:+ start:224 stop:475 length:252 start_codon:yes stop_codon:yes gene_type:complete
MTTPQDKLAITQKTLLPLSLVIALCGGVVWMSSQLNAINYKLDVLETGMRNNWTEHDMENWGLKLKLVNPAIILPDIDTNRKE